MLNKALINPPPFISLDSDKEESTNILSSKSLKSSWFLKNSLNDIFSKLVIYILKDRNFKLKYIKILDFLKI